MTGLDLLNVIVATLLTARGFQIAIRNDLHRLVLWRC